MRKRIKHMTPRPTTNQRGVVLFVALIFLVILSLIAVTAARMQTTEERMARNEDSRQIAEAAAEAALRNGEDSLNSNPPPIGVFAADCCGFYLLTSSGSAVPSNWWTNAAYYVIYGTAPLSTGPLLTNLPTASRTPKILIERMGGGTISGDNMSTSSITYRVTAVASSPDGTASSMLQSIYR